MADTNTTPPGKTAVKKSTAAPTAEKTLSKRGAGKTDTPPTEPMAAKAVAKSGTPRVKAAKPSESKVSPEVGAGGENTEKAKPVAKPSVVTKKATEDAAAAPRPASRKSTGVAKKSDAIEAKASAGLPAGTTGAPDQQEVDRMIAEAAYYLAEKRNFEPGWEQEDWETATNEVMRRLQTQHR